MTFLELHHSAYVRISAHFLVIERNYDIVARFECCFLRPVKNGETEFSTYRACPDKELILFRDFEEGKFILELFSRNCLRVFGILEER